MAKGHRNRVRIRSNEQEADSIPEYEVLEMIMHGVIKQKDVGAVARALIEKFGSLAQVIDAPARDLCKVEGVGPISADFIKKIPFFYFKYKQSKWKTHEVFDNLDDIMQFLSDRFIIYRNETVLIMCFDSKFKLLACKTLFEGGIDAVDINMRKIIDFVISTNATRVIIAHNHPDGSLTPSHADKQLTRHLYNVLSFANVVLEDHIIVTDDGCKSLASSGDVPHLNDDVAEDDIIE